jgi:hypothetical protein
LPSSAPRYPQAIFALEEQILLQPQSGFAVLQLAETQYTAARYEEACTSYLRVLEMAHVEEGVRKTGPWMRAVWGLKMVSLACTRQMDESWRTRRDKYCGGEASQAVLNRPQDAVAQQRRTLASLSHPD